jgi:hypothetical protein
MQDSEDKYRLLGVEAERIRRQLQGKLGQEEEAGELVVLSVRVKGEILAMLGRM